MVVTRNGGLSASVQRLAVVEYRLEPELAPTHHHNTVVGTAVPSAPLPLPESATIMSA